MKAENCDDKSSTTVIPNIYYEIMTIMFFKEPSRMNNVKYGTKDLYK